MSKKIRQLGRLGSFHYDHKSQQKGDNAEKKVKDALELLKWQGKILGFVIYPMLSPQDRRGVDATIFIPHKKRRRLSISIQIKSSELGAKRHYKKYGKYDIEVIIANPKESTEDICKKLRVIIQNHTSKPKQQTQGRSSDSSNHLPVEVQKGVDETVAHATTDKTISPATPTSAEISQSRWLVLRPRTQLKKHQ